MYTVFYRTDKSYAPLLIKMIITTKSIHRRPLHRRTYCVWPGIRRWTRAQVVLFVAVDHMSGGPIVGLRFNQRNCVEEWGRLIGPAAYVPYARRFYPVSLHGVYLRCRCGQRVPRQRHAVDGRTENTIFFPNGKRNKPIKILFSFSRYHFADVTNRLQLLKRRVYRISTFIYYIPK